MENDIQIKKIIFFSSTTYEQRFELFRLATNFKNIVLVLVIKLYIGFSLVPNKKKKVILVSEVLTSLKFNPYP